MAWKSTPEQLRKAQAISHLRRVGKPLPEEWKEKMRKKAKTPERLAIAIKNLPKYKKGEHPSLGKKFTEIHRKRISEAKKWKPKPNQSGAKCNFWKGGITPINKKTRTSLAYKLWRESVYKRDNYTCIWCGDNKGGNLEADHIKPFALFPELRFVVDNGRTLCASCHRKTDTYLNKSRWPK